MLALLCDSTKPVYAVPQREWCGASQTLGGARTLPSSLKSKANPFADSSQISTITPSPVTLLRTSRNPCRTSASPLDSWWTAFRRVHAAAPLKPRMAGTNQPGVLAFRRVHAAAPLKLWRAALIHGAKSSFRRVHAAAPLKRKAAEYNLCSMSLPFRRVHAAAPLKPTTARPMQKTL